MNFIVILSTVWSKNTFWIMTKHNTYDALLIITDKYSKKVLLIFDYIIYIVAEWAEVDFRFLLLIKWGIPKITITNKNSNFFFGILNDAISFTKY